MIKISAENSLDCDVNTDKKENENFLIYKDINLRISSYSMLGSPVYDFAPDFI